MSKFYYAVAKGYETGIYNTWAECSNMVDGFSGAKYKTNFNKRALKKCSFFCI